MTADPHFNVCWNQSSVPDWPAEGRTVQQTHPVKFEVLVAAEQPLSVKKLTAGSEGTFVCRKNQLLDEKICRLQNVF